LDIGGQSTRPGANYISAEEEIKRTLPVIKKIRSAYPNCTISIDTFNAYVAEKALEAGVKVVAGTDAGGFVHGNNAHELELLVKHGMSPMQAIQAATGWAAECVGMEKDIGTVEAGKLADLVIIDGNPISDIRILQDKDKIMRVFKGGSLFVDHIALQ